MSKMMGLFGQQFDEHEKKEGGSAPAAGGIKVVAEEEEEEEPQEVSQHSPIPLPPTTHVHTYRHMAREAGSTRAHIFTHAHTPSRTRTHILTRAHTRMRAQIFTAGALKSKAQAAAKKPLIQGSLRGPGGGRERWRGVDRGGREQDQTWTHKRIHIRTYKETYKDTYANKTI